MIRECLLRVRQFIIIIIFCCFFCKCVPRKRLFSNENHWPIIKFFWMNSLRYLWNNHFRLSFFYEIIRRTCNNNSECIRHYIHIRFLKNRYLSLPLPPNCIKYSIYYLAKNLYLYFYYEKETLKKYIYLYLFSLFKFFSCYKV